MWYLPEVKPPNEPPPEGFSRPVSEEYYRDWYGKRPPLRVILPNGFIFNIDSPVTGKTTGWQVTGDPPNITLSPSVNYASGDPNGWHGYIQNGEITDDLEGRTYDD